MSIGFPTAPLAFRHTGAGGGAVENPQAAQHFHYLARKPVQLIPTTAYNLTQHPGIYMSSLSLFLIFENHKLKGFFRPLIA
ncbi:MAG TPA: hypothetical protein VFP43_20500, partial [Mesorhizobium sp.]|nr:hypothetical protein [Mesorhizobium sp.]